MDDKKEQLQAAQACNRDVPTDEPTAKQDCSDVVNISVFFDGTGNNKDVDEKPKKWSNVARMWRSAVMSSELLSGKNTIHPIYISGVGTPFNGTAAGWIDGAKITVEDKVWGNAGGAGGTRRTEFGQNNVNNTLRQALLNNAKQLGGTTKAYAEKAKDQSFSDLSKALAPHRLIKVINLSLFGFSRGAALARAFSNDFLKLCKTDETGQLIYERIPVRIHFMGLFDTVASFGAPSANMDGLFSEKNLLVPGKTERCVHYVAAHELRFSFPVDLIRQHGRLMPNWTETIYPGVHSDVGGGYMPLTAKDNDNSTNQGISDNYARIPMRDMMSEAVKAGVRMLSYSDVEKTNAPIFDERFAVKEKTEEAYKHYMAAVAPSGTIEQVIAAHMKALYSAYGTMTRKKIKTPDLVQAESTTGYTLIGHISMAREAEALLNPDKAKSLKDEQATKSLAMGLVTPLASVPQALQFAGTAYIQRVRPEAWRLQAWSAPANDSVVTFIKDLIHDSKAGFIMGVEPFSYFRPRGMAESSRNVLAKGMQWLDENVAAATNGVIKIYHTAEGVVVETWKQGVLTATQTYKVGEKFTIDTINAGEKYAVEVYNTSKQVVISTVDAGQKMIVSSYNTAQKKANELADAAQKKATEVGQEIQQGATKLSNEAGQAYDAAKKTASDMATQAGQGAKQVSDAVGNKVDAGMKAVEDGWKATKSLLGF
jgi:predicted RNA-binding protein with PIN domain